MERIEVYTSKKKLFISMILSFVFVLLGTYLLIEPGNFSKYKSSPIITQVIGVSSILLFGVAMILSLIRVINPQLALIIDSQGLNVNPKKSLTDNIKWNEIKGFKEIKINSTKIIIIEVHNPSKWIKNETNLVRRKMMQFNNANYSSPNISAVGLDISYDQLIETLNKYYNQYKIELKDTIP